MQSHFKFNKQERSGIFFLLFIVILLQVGYFILRFFSSDEAASSFSLDAPAQAKIDAMKERALVADSVKIFPFNPNFISDYKGYTLGMSVAEIDRLHAFRAENEYVNSPEGFQKVTKISDSLLKVISPYFKFPEWTKKSKQSKVSGQQFKARHDDSFSTGALRRGNSEVFQVKDLNSVTAEELKSIKGVGEKLSVRIIKFRDRLGGFLVDEQLYDVYFLEPSVANHVLKKFKVFNKPVVEMINVNTASVDAIASLVYIKYDVAREIVSYREENGPYLSLNELGNIEGFPTDKIDRIALYLSL